MLQDDTPPEEKPRFLLPDGCKDLIDALRLKEQQREPDAIADHMPTTASSSPDEPLPKSVSIPDPILVRDLATALHMKGYEIVRALMEQNMFVTPQTMLDFAKAATLCSRLGVVAHKII